MNNIYEVKIVYETERDNGSIKKEKGCIIVEDALSIVEAQSKAEGWLKGQGETRDYSFGQIKHLSNVEAVVR